MADRIQPLIKQTLVTSAGILHKGTDRKPLSDISKAGLTSKMEKLSQEISEYKARLAQASEKKDPMPI